MRYLDSGKREPSQALGSWLKAVLAKDVVEVRWQSGFFAADSLSVIEPALRRLTRADRTVRALIGSNDQCTLRGDVERLASLLGIPRKKALLGVVAYRQGFYHPKTFHVQRSDGSQAAYVGSANLTGSGVASLHVEAGVAADSREGDSAELLRAIALGVDYWFDESPPGLHKVSSLAEIAGLVGQGILSEAGPPRPVAPRHASEGGPRPSITERLQPLIPLPVQGLVREIPSALIEATPLPAVFLPAAPRQEFPPYSRRIAPAKGAAL